MADVSDAEFSSAFPPKSEFDAAFPPKAGKGSDLPISQRGPTPIIRGPNTIWEKVLGGFYEALPFLGAAGGAAVGAPAGPLGAPAGGALGYAGGRQAARTIATGVNRMRGLPGPSGIDPVSTAKNVVEDVGTGLGMEAGGVVGSRVLQGLRPGTPDPKTLAARQAAGRQGITLTPAAEQGSPGLAKAQELPTRLPIGGGPARKGFEEARESMRQGAEGLVTSAGGREPLIDALDESRRVVESISKAQKDAPGELVDRFIEDTFGASRQGRLALGGSVQDALRTTAQNLRQQAKTLYDKALDEGGRGSMVGLTNTYERASQIAAEEARLRAFQSQATPKAQSLKGISEAPPLDFEKLPPEMQSQILRRMGPNVGADFLASGAKIPVADLPTQIIERYGLSRSGERPLEDVIAIQQRIRAAMRSKGIDDVSRRQLRDLLDAVTGDLGAHGRGTRFGPFLREASDFYKKEVAEDFAKGGVLRKMVDARAGEVGAEILRTRNPETIRNLMGRLPERQQDEVRRAVIDQMRDKATADGTLNPAQLEQSFRLFGDENLGFLMGPRVREVDAVRRLLNTQFGPATMEPAYERMLRGSATSLAQQLTKGNVRTVMDMERIWPTLPQETQRSFMRGVLTNTLEHAVDPATGEFSAARFLTAKRALPQSFWDKILPTTQQDILRDLETVFRHVTRVDRTAANYSGTAQGLMAWSQISELIGSAGAALVSPSHIPSLAMGAAASTAGPWALGKFIFSPTGRRFLVAPDAPPAASTSQGVARTLYRLLATQVNERINPVVPQDKPAPTPATPSPAGAPPPSPVPTKRPEITTPEALKTRSGLESMASDVAANHGLTGAAKDRWLAIIQQESRWKPGAVGDDTRSGDRAVGLGQVMPATGALYGKSASDLKDPYQNLDTSAQHFKSLLDRYHGNVDLATRRYFGTGTDLRGYSTYDYLRDVLAQQKKRLRGPAPAEATR